MWKNSIMPTIKFEPIKISKVILSLIVSLTALGFGEYYYKDLKVLFWFGVVLSVISSISVLFVLIAYTISFWNRVVCKSCKK